MPVTRTSRLLCLTIVVSIVAAAIGLDAKVAPAAPQVIAITAGGSVGVPAGDYALTISGMISATPTYGEIAQMLNGAGSLLRTADFYSIPSPSTITAQVRVSGPGDTFAPITAGIKTTWSSMALTPASWSFIARGTQIVGPAGNSVIWHGINSIPDMAAQDYTNVATVYPKASIDRVMIDEGCWDPYFVAGQATKFCAQLGGSAKYQANIRQAVNSITSRGQVAMLLVNNAGRDNPNWVVQAQTDDFGPDQHTLALYHNLDMMYGNNPKVIFETTNEPKMIIGQTYGPNSIDGGVLWLNGGLVDLQNITWNAPGVQQIVNQIRDDKANNLVLVEGSAWGENLLTVEKTPVVGTNIAYSYHGYRSPDNQTSYPPAWDTQIAPVVGATSSYRYAGFLSEFGTTQADLLPPTVAAGSQYLQSCITWSVNRSMGWAAWGWYPDTWGDKFAIVHTYQPLVLNSKGKTVTGNF